MYNAVPVCIVGGGWWVVSFVDTRRRANNNLYSPGSGPEAEGRALHLIQDP